MNKNIMKKYAQLKSQQIDIEFKLNELKPDVIEAMGDQKAISNGYGKFTQVVSRKFLFSRKLTNYEAKQREKIASMKRKEIDKGDIPWSESTSLRYDLPKVKVN